MKLPAAFQVTFRGCLHGISFRAKLNTFILMSGQFLITVYMIQPEMKLIAGAISLRSFWQKWNFISGDKISCKHYPKWNHMKGNISTCVNKNDWPFISDYPRNKIQFISTAMKSDINRIFFIACWNFVSGRFHFGSHVNTLLDTFKRCIYGPIKYLRWSLSKKYWKAKSSLIFFSEKLHHIYLTGS